MRKSLLFLLVLASCILAACKNTPVYYHFEHTPEIGWERTDALGFGIKPMAIDGSYQELIGLRISANYPYMSLSLIIEQTIFPAGKTFCDTLDCRLIDENGNAIGSGISQHQYMFPLRNLHLLQGDSIQCTIRHNMKREILPGITDVGLCLQE